MLGHYLVNLRIVAGMYKSEFLDLKNIVSMYGPESKVVMFEKIASAPLYALPMLITSVRRRFLPVTTRTFWGERMTVVIPEGGSMSIINTGFIEPELTKWILRYVKGGMTVLDIGAHYGYFTMLASHLVGPQGQVHAFEPTPSTFSILELNARRLSNVFTNHVACFSRNGSMLLSDFGHRYSGFNTLVKSRMGGLSVARRIKVQTQKLDDYVEAKDIKPNFVKIDAESTESDVLEGMSEVIQRHRPMISLEVGDFVASGIPSKDLISGLLDKGYHAYESRNDIMREHKVREKYGYENILFVPDPGR